MAHDVYAPPPCPDQKGFGICSECAGWVQRDFLPPNHGECRLKAARPVGRMHAEGHRHSDAPVRSANDWCGEWVKRKV